MCTIWNLSVSIRFWKRSLHKSSDVVLFFSVRIWVLLDFALPVPEMWLEEIDIGGPSLPYF